MASINNWPLPAEQADSAPQRSEGDGMILEFVLTGITVRAVRTVPVVGTDGQPIQYTSDVSDLTLMFSPATETGKDIYAIQTEADSENEAIAEALGKLAALASRVADMEVHRRGTESRYHINGASRKITPL